MPQRPTPEGATFDSAIEQDMAPSKAAGPKSRLKMSDDDILAEVKLEISGSVGGNNTTIEQSRRDAIRYYNGPGIWFYSVGFRCVRSL